MTASEPSTIYYTTDGNTPTTGSLVYSAPITISSTTTLKFIARDTAGNTQTTSQTITIDTTNPSVVITSPSDGELLSSGSFSVTGIASDNFGLLRVEVSIDGGSYNTAFGTNNWLYNVSGLSSGTHTISARAVDNAGNLSTVVTISVNVQ